MHDDDIRKLQRVVADGGTALEIDDALLPFVATSDPSVISPLLALLNESGDQDGMWSMLHMAESFDTSPYVTGLLSALPTLADNCPWWAEVLIIRILNSELYSAELVAQLRSAPDRTKEAIAEISEKLSKDARFYDKVVPVLAVTRC